MSLSLLIIVALSVGFSGCGGESSNPNSTPTDVTVERGKVYDAIVIDSQNNVGTQKLGINYAIILA